MQLDQTLRQAVYHSECIRAWEHAWFANGASQLGLMQQAAWRMATLIVGHVDQSRHDSPRLLIWCGRGLNGLDGRWMGYYLASHFNLAITLFTPLGLADTLHHLLPPHCELVTVTKQLNDFNAFNVHIDALWGIGLNRPLAKQDCDWINRLNQCDGYKIAVDVPSGLDASTGMPLPQAVKVDWTLCLIALKSGLITGEGPNYVGRLCTVHLLPPHPNYPPLGYYHAYRPYFAPRLAHQHKGDFGHVAVIGGHAHMGGAVIMAAEAAMASGAGRVTVICHANHHSAILARSPNIMVRDLAQWIQQPEALFEFDSVCFGMGLGRDAQSQSYFDTLLPLMIQQRFKTVVLDADALYFLADRNKTYQTMILPDWCILTPHAGEAARLLGQHAQQVEADRIQTIRQLQSCYGGQWVFKGAGSLTLNQHAQLDICAFGNPGMATAGMGDTLAGLIASLKGQFDHEIELITIVTLHALAGDELAKQGERGLQATELPALIRHLINFRP